MTTAEHPEALDYVRAEIGMRLGPLPYLEFIEEAFGLCGMKFEWQGTGIEEKGIDPASGRTLVEVDPNYFRPTEVETLIGDPRKAKEKLGWVHETPFKELVRMMVEADLKLAGLDSAKIMGA